MPFSVGPLISRASSISANLYAVTNETYQLTKYGECSVESTETTGESGVRTDSSYAKQLTPLHGFCRRFMRTFRGARRLRFAPSSPVEFASKIGIHHFIDARRFKWRSTRWPASLLTNQCW